MSEHDLPSSMWAYGQKLSPFENTRPPFRPKAILAGKCTLMGSLGWIPVSATTPVAIPYTAPVIEGRSEVLLSMGDEFQPTWCD